MKKLEQKIKLQTIGDKDRATVLNDVQKSYGNFQDGVPGPGYYFSKEEKDVTRGKYQFFGSSSQRF